MKKLITLCCIALVSAGLYATEEIKSDSLQTYTSQEREKFANDYKDFTHWSINVNVGMSQFDGDCTQAPDQMLSASHVDWTLGLDVEYSFNPVWGLAAEFRYMPYRGITSSTEYGHNAFRGNMYNPSLIASINLTNLFGPNRTRADWNWFINAGVGMSFYDCESAPITKDASGNEVVGEYSPALEGGSCISFPIGTKVEYNINKYLAVGLGAFYRLHNKDNFEGEAYTKGTMNDGEFYVTAGLRVKFVPNKKDGGHMRNISMSQYRSLRSGETNFQEDLDSLTRRVEILEDTVNNNILPRIVALEAEFAVDPDDDMDGVPNLRDREPNSPQGAYVNYWGESLPQEVVNGCCEKVNTLIAALGIDPEVDYNMSVYFGFDKATLTKAAHKNIDKAIKKLNDNPEVQVELRGYCDFPGSKDYNLKLSQRRVNAVKAELLKAGIAEERISVEPQGTLANPPKQEQKNRRCDFFFY